MAREQKGFRDKTLGKKNKPGVREKQSEERKTGLDFGFKGRTTTKGFNDTNGQQRNISHLTGTRFQKSSGTDFQTFSTCSSSWILYHHQAPSGLHHGTTSPSPTRSAPNNHYTFGKSQPLPERREASPKLCERFFLKN